LFISPVEWRKLRAQQNRERRNLSDKAFQQRKKKVEKKAGARAGQVAKVGDLVLMRVDAKFASGHSSKWNGVWMGPFRVSAINRGGLDITVYHIGSSAVLSRHARDFKLYFSEEEDDDQLRQDNEFEVRQVLGIRGEPHEREFYVSWERYPTEFDQWVGAHNLTPELIAEAEAKFGGVHLPKEPEAVASTQVPVLPSTASVERAPTTSTSPSSVPRIAGKKIQGKLPEKSVSFSDGLVQNDFEIVSTKTTRHGTYYTIRFLNSEVVETVPERRIPVARRERRG
jgi:hypothetical protein